MSDPLLFSLVQDLEFQTGYRIKQVVATRTDILDAIENGYPDKALAKYTGVTGGRLGPGGRSRSRAAGRGDSSPGSRARRRAGHRCLRAGAVGDRPAREGSDSAPIIDLVDLVVNSAITSRASDVHIEPQEKGVLVRHRLDGILKEVMDLPKWVHEGLVARMKIMAGMDIAEKRLPQDGRLRVKTEDGKDVDFRVSTLRTHARREDRHARARLSARGRRRSRSSASRSPAMEELRYFLKHQHGMILVVGPTGSGKTTTLSSAITSVKSGRTNIITIEDPIEYQIPGINQTQVNEKAKLTFASALRAILRQDPDVILVGEIRDHETAKIAMQAAQTGHLVLSTLHTDDAPSTMTRLMDMGLEPYIIASALIGVVAQRLVRRLCTACRRQYTPEGETLRSLNMTEADAAHFVFYRAVGCEECNHTGYRGRIGIYEVMRVNDKVRRLIAQKRGRGHGPRRRGRRRHDHARRRRRWRRSSPASTSAEELLPRRDRSERSRGRSARAATRRSAWISWPVRTAGTASTPAARKCGRAAAGRVAVLPLLHDEHQPPSRPRSSCAISERCRARRRRTSLNSRIRTIVEELLRHARIAAGGCLGRRDQEGLPARDRALPSRQGAASRPRVPGDGLGDRRRSDRGLPDPDGSGAAREVRPGSARQRRGRRRAGAPPARPPAAESSHPPPPAQDPAPSPASSSTSYSASSSPGATAPRPTAGIDFVQARATLEDSRGDCRRARRVRSRCPRRASTSRS